MEVKSVEKGIGKVRGSKGMLRSNNNNKRRREGGREEFEERSMG
jgi:hypothetical protein